MHPATPPEKSLLHAHCIGLVQAGIDAMNAQLAGLAESVANETKSTAGDKYETARAMLHIEQDQVRGRLRAALVQLETLRSIDPAVVPPAAAAGSLVQLSTGWFYISTGLGKVRFDGDTVFCVSILSPLAAAIRGRSSGETISFNGQRLSILKLL